MSLTACNDYLDVDAPSSYTEGFVYGSTDEVNRALDGVYTQALSNNLYGNLYQRDFNLNSDVDIIINSSNQASGQQHTTSSSMLTVSLMVARTARSISQLTPEHPSCRASVRQSASAT